MFTDVYEYLKLSREKRREHLRLDEPCIEIGRSDQFRGLLAYYLKTTIPFGRNYHLCHACNNAKCSNVKHLYWGTSADNNVDSFSYRNAAAIVAHNKRKGSPMMEETKRKISAALKGKRSNNPTGINNKNALVV